MNKNYLFLLTALIILILIFIAKYKLGSGSESKNLSHNNSVNFSEHFRINHIIKPGGSNLSIIISLDPGFHAYAMGEKIGQPVRLEISPEGAWEALGPAQIPAGHEKSLGSNTSLVLTGNIPISQDLKAGSGPGQAWLFLQICTATTCDRPRKHEIPLLIRPKNS